MAAVFAMMAELAFDAIISTLETEAVKQVENAVYNFAEKKARELVGPEVSRRFDEHPDMISTFVKESVLGIGNANGTDYSALTAEALKRAKDRVAAEEEEKKRDSDEIHGDFHYTLPSPCDCLVEAINVDENAVVTEEIPVDINEDDHHLVVPEHEDFTAAELADLLIKHTTEIAITKNIDESTITVADTPRKMSLMKRLSNYYTDQKIPVSEEYVAIAAVYDGRGLSPDNVIGYEDETKWKFGVYDEVSDFVVCEQLKSATTIPSIYGVYGGPSSRNNEKPIDECDTYFMCHDSAYAEGYFNLRADYQLIARLSQNRDKWPENKIHLLNSIVVYFATIGVSLAKMKGSLPHTVSREVVLDDTRDDVFPVLVPSSQDLDLEEYNKARFDFYSELEHGMEVSSKTSSVMAVQGGGGGGRLLGREFGEIRISID